MRTKVQGGATGPNVFVDLSGFDRIRMGSSRGMNSRVEQEMIQRVESLSQASPAELSERISELEREWDIDRALMMLFPVLALVPLIQALRGKTRWLGLLGIQSSFLALHASQGWCPPGMLLRSLGFRSRDEIDAEKYALKTLRGDFVGKKTRSRTRKGRKPNLKKTEPKNEREEGDRVGEAEGAA